VKIKAKARTKMKASIKIRADVSGLKQKREWRSEAVGRLKA
jgi:hypothetical protein